MSKLIDLSQDIYEGMQVYPGHLKTVVFQHATHEETAVRFDSGFSFQTLGFMLNDNGPTHVDSFSHLDPDPGAETIDQMSLDLFFGPALCLDVSHVPAAPTSLPSTSTRRWRNRGWISTQGTCCSSTRQRSTATRGPAPT